MSNKSNPTVATMGIDIGKNSFHVVGLDQRGAIVLRQKWSRRQIEARLANVPRCLIGMEACVGAHHLSRKLQSHGHDARLMPAKYVRPYSKGQKNDFRDAEAIAEAVQRPTMKFVATKTADQLDLQALHRVRERLVSQRTGIINQIRAFLLERGVAVRQGLRFLRTELPGILATRSDVLSSRMIHVIEDLAGDWHRLDERIESLSTDIKGLADQDPACERLMTVPGIGPIISSAMVAAIGNGTASITRLQRLGREFQRAFRQARTSALGTLIESRLATSTSASGSPISRPRARRHCRIGARLRSGSRLWCGLSPSANSPISSTPFGRVSRVPREKTAGRSENAMRIPDIQGIRAWPVLLKLKAGRRAHSHDRGVAGSAAVSKHGIVKT